jgi:hypothetical protein
MEQVTTHNRKENTDENTGQTNHIWNNSYIQIDERNYNQSRYENKSNREGKAQPELV